MRFKLLVTSRSKKLAAMLGVFCFGVLVGPLFGWVAFSWMITAMTLLLIAMVFVYQRRELFLALVLALALLLGIFRYTQSVIPEHVTTVADRTGMTIRVNGIIASEVETKINGQRVILDRVSVADESVDGKLIVQLPSYPEVRYADSLTFSCRLENPEPFNGFAYDRYLQSKGVLAVCGFPQYVDVERGDSFTVIGSILSIKHVLTDRIEMVVNEPHASFLSGLLFGGSSSLSRSLQDDFARTGTSHILAASGFNVSLFSVAFLSWILSTRLGRKRGLILTSALLVVYMIAAGATPAVVRATVMAGLLVVQKWVRRDPSVLNLMLVTAGLMLLINPRILLDDPGFQLSFIATASILYFVPRWREWFSWLPERFGLRETVVASLAAITFTLPIVLWHFGSVSLVAPLVNLVVLPLVPFAMIATALAILASIIWIPFAQLISLPAWAFSFVILQIISTYSAWSFASVSFEVAQLLAVAVVVLFVAIAIHRRYETEHCPS